MRAHTPANTDLCATLLVPIFKTKKKERKTSPLARFSRSFFRIARLTPIPFLSLADPSFAPRGSYLFLYFPELLYPNHLALAQVGQWGWLGLAEGQGEGGAALPRGLGEKPGRGAIFVVV